MTGSRFSLRMYLALFAEVFGDFTDFTSQLLLGDGCDQRKWVDVILLGSLGVFEVAQLSQEV